MNYLLSELDRDRGGRRIPNLNATATSVAFRRLSRSQPRAPDPQGLDWSPLDTLRALSSMHSSQ
ncbi:hypothetical protein Taro_027605 [Colocasia esculenta]|uniref:Uncharacterized protein n=1 Tax=Colocasia esculenta TaxID=4460 RepID=A0A843VEZ6_COLES|nr:hypothetical protein [Colocasia esculenta]